jgi:hypothetical protein
MAKSPNLRRIFAASYREGQRLAKAGSSHGET